MSNGNPPPVSGSSYIIICSRRIQVKLAKTAAEIVIAVSSGAGELCAFMELKFNATPADMAAISQLQHFLMDNADALRWHEAHEKAEEMFALLTELEHKYPMHAY